MTPVQIVESVLRVVSAVAPGVLAALAGTESDEEAIARALEHAEGLPVRTGDGGAWTAADAAQDARIRAEGDPAAVGLHPEAVYAEARALATRPTEPPEQPYPDAGSE